MRTAYPWMGREMIHRFGRLYGTRMKTIVGAATSVEGLGRRFGRLTEAEVRYLVAHEWAERPQDILWRRTKEGLHMTPAERAEFAEWFESAQLSRAA